jgi:hypothetical protein
MSLSGYGGPPLKSQCGAFGNLGTLRANFRVPLQGLRLPEVTSPPIPDNPL